MYVATRTKREMKYVVNMGKLDKKKGGKSGRSAREKTMGGSRFMFEKDLELVVQITKSDREVKISTFGASCWIGQ